MEMTRIQPDIKDINLAEQGKNNIEWAMKDMPVLRKIRIIEERIQFLYACRLRDYASRINFSRNT